ncbi:Uncharacterized protein APZ42_007310 [Daphnia magna]|uniref:Uncharacterized protein n=1 Tax=Daphnia magna TaxID=35525 RepID=A0A162BUM9_9CRUS|nr:Uncharacterized protein APZ42_007310 [Daphnia magna]
MVSKGCWNAVNGAGENTMNWGLFEGFKRERSLKSGETQTMGLLTTQGVGGCLRDTKGKGLSMVLEHSQLGC